MNKFLNGMAAADNVTLTENGGIALKSTMDKVYDMFALGGAYRKRNDEDCILLFKNAFEEDPELALKCLFYIRDCRGGQGERRFFRVVLKWLANTQPEIVKANLDNIAEYGRYDDLFVLFDTPVELSMVKMVHEQLILDMQCKTPSLLAKWMPSINTSSAETRKLANRFRSLMDLNAKTYRQILSSLRNKINILETLMSQNRWEEIEFDKIPSKAGLKYRNAFARRDIIAKRYEQFIKDEKTQVNAKVLYPYEIVAAAAKGVSVWGYHFENFDPLERETLEKYWNNLPDYMEGNPAKMMCVVDTSGSMIGKEAAAPINVAIALGMYCAERIGGPFKDHFISFSRRPKLIKIEGVDFVDKVQRIYRQNLCENTNLEATFDLIYNIARSYDVPKEDVPDTLVIISDMEIDEGTTFGWDNTKHRVKTMMEQQREKWTRAGLRMPHLVYWNVASHDQNKFLDDGPGVTYVSGASPVIFKSVLKGVTGKDLMYDILNGERYAAIKLK